MSEKPRHHQGCPWRPPRESGAGEELVFGPACECDDLWARELGHAPGADPSAAMGQESAAWSEVELRRELASWQASYAALNEELAATRNARDLAIEPFEGVNMKLVEARRMLDKAPRITDNGRGVPTYYLREEDGTRIQLVKLAQYEEVAGALRRAQGELAARPVLQHWDCFNTHSLEYQCGRCVELMRVELTRLEELRDAAGTEPPNGAVVVDATHVAWQRRDTDALAAPTDCWFQVGQEDGDPWTTVTAAGPVTVVWMAPEATGYEHAHIVDYPSTGRVACEDCGTSANSAEELATVPCETGEARATHVAVILEGTQASQSEALERPRAEGDGD